MVERLLCTQDVAGSIPVASTTLFQGEPSQSQGIQPNPGAVLICGDEKTEDRKSSKKSQSREKVGNFSGAFLTVPQAAKKLGIDAKTVTGWCKSGKLAATAKPYGKKITYLISPQALELIASISLRPQKRVNRKATVSFYRDGLRLCPKEP